MGEVRRDFDALRRELWGRKQLNDNRIEQLAAAIQEKVFKRPADEQRRPENQEFPRLTAEQIEALLDSAK